MISLDLGYAMYIIVTPKNFIYIHMTLLIVYI